MCTSIRKSDVDRNVRGVDYNRKLDELNKKKIYIYKYMYINTYLYTTAYISYVFVDIYLNIESCSVYNFMDSFFSCC